VYDADMGHYLSEMGGDPDPNYKPPVYVKKSPDDKPVRIYTRGQSVEGSFTEETVETDYAVQFDSYDEDTRYKPDAPGDPENWKYRRERQHIHGPSFHLHGDGALEKWLKFAKELIRIKGDQDRTKRPGLIMCRKVTYGPWEILGEESEHDEGWF